MRVTYILINPREREPILRCTSPSLESAIEWFSQRKQLSREALLEIYEIVTEEHDDKPKIHGKKSR